LVAVVAVVDGALEYLQLALETGTPANNFPRIFDLGDAVQAFRIFMDKLYQFL
jgi:hypothetical protein